MQKPIRLLIFCLVSSAFLCSALLTIILVYWHLHGMEVVSVQSNSMAPTFRAGDAVLVRAVAEQDLRVGQVLMLKDSKNTAAPITHRLMSVEPHTNRIVTQGDANNSADPATDLSSVQGRAEVVLPRFGILLDLMRSPLGLVAMVYGPATYVLYQELQRLARAWQRKVYRLKVAW